MAIYTKTGDNGTAGLFSGKRVLKCHDQIEAFGDVDELNSALGVLRAVIPEEYSVLTVQIKKIQSDLLHLGAWLATAPDAETVPITRQIHNDDICFLEKAIDRMDRELPPIKTFDLPGGNITASYAHLARAICRRAERHVVRLAVDAPLGKPPRQLRWPIIYLNRLSDYLFVFARYCDQHIALKNCTWIVQEKKELEEAQIFG